MDLLELRYFREIAASRSLSRAASRLCVSQPTLSRQLAKLEAEVRSALFYRNGRGVSLTEAGERLLAVAGPALQQLSDVRDELQSHQLDDVGEVSLGTPPSIAASVGAPLSIDFATRHPKARLRIRESFSGVLLEWIEAGRIDMAVLYDVRRGSNVLSTPLLLEDLFLIEAPAAGPRPGGPAELTELAQRACVLTGTENGLRRVVDAACWSERVQPNVLMEIDCVAALKQLVEGGTGCTVLPFGAVHREVAEGRLVARPFGSPAMRALLVLATSPNRPVNRLMRATIGLLQAQVQNLTSSGVLRGRAHGPGSW